MEIAKLVLEYINVLIWPCITLLIAFKFKDVLIRFLEKMMGSQELEVDLFGQKIKMKAMEKLAKEIGNESKASSKENNDKSGTSYSPPQLLKNISSLSNEEVAFLAKVANYTGHQWYYLSSNEGIIAHRLKEFGLLVSGSHSDGVYVEVTPLGKKIISDL